MIPPKYILAGLIIILTGACRTSKFSFQSTPVSDTNLNMQGYFYTTDTTSLRYNFRGQAIVEKGYRVNMYFLFSNGIYNHVASTFCNEITEGVEDLLREAKRKDIYYKRYQGELKRQRGSWGRFMIAQDHIILEKPGAGRGFPILRQEGKILNDSTILITKNISNRKEYAVENTWRFKSYTSKPDSLNAVF